MKSIIVGFSIILIIIIGYLSIKEMKERNKLKLANQFNIISINFKKEDKQTTIDQLTNLIGENDATYSSGSDWWFQMVFCATAASIVSGAVAVRVELKAFLVFVVFQEDCYSHRQSQVLSQLENKERRLIHS